MGVEFGVRFKERGVELELGRLWLRIVFFWRLGWYFDFGVVEKLGVKMIECFDCYYCNEFFFGKKYILWEESFYCVVCFEILFVNICEECGKFIGCDCKDLFYKDWYWYEVCFYCL